MERSGMPESASSTSDARAESTTTSQTQESHPESSAILRFSLLNEHPEVMSIWDLLDVPTKRDILDITTEDVIASSYMASFQDYGRAISATRRDDGTTPTDLDYKTLNYHRTLYTQDEIQTVENLLNLPTFMNSLRNTFADSMSQGGDISLPPGEFPSSTPAAQFLLESIFRSFAHRLRAWYTFVKTRNTIYYALIIWLLAGRLFELKSWMQVLLSYLLMALAWQNHWLLDRFIWAPLFHGIDNRVTLRAIDAYSPVPGLSQLCFGTPSRKEDDEQSPQANLFVRALGTLSRVFHDPDPLRQIHRIELICMPLLIAGLERAATAAARLAAATTKAEGLHATSGEYNMSITSIMISILVLAILEAERAAAGSVEASACAWTFEAALARVSSFFALRARTAQMTAAAASQSEGSREQQAKFADALKAKADSLLIGPFVASSGAFITHQAVVLMLASARSLAMLGIRLYVMYKAFMVDWSTFLMVLWLVWPNFTTTLVGGAMSLFTLPAVFVTSLKEKLFPKGTPLLATIVLGPVLLYTYFAYYSSDAGLLWKIIRLIVYLTALIFVLPTAVVHIGVSLLFGIGTLMATSTGGKCAVLATLPIVGFTQIPRFLAIFLYKLYTAAGSAASQPHWIRIALVLLQCFQFNPDCPDDLEDTPESS